MQNYNITFLLSRHFPNKITLLTIFNVNVNEIVGKVLKDFKMSSQRNTNH